MSTFTCFGCGETVPLVQMDVHKTKCRVFGQRNFVPQEWKQEPKPMPAKDGIGLEKWL